MEVDTKHNLKVAYCTANMQSDLANILRDRIFHMPVGFREQPSSSWRACRTNDHELGQYLRSYTHRMLILPPWLRMANHQATP